RQSKNKEDLKLSQLLTQALLELADKSTSLVKQRKGQTGFSKTQPTKTIYLLPPRSL
ncbi:hypothetical protein BSPWISOXPB_6159, partial [uncultured Gammaproteobacteria bacterium]